LLLGPLELVTQKLDPGLHELRQHRLHLLGPVERFAKKETRPIRVLDEELTQRFHRRIEPLFGGCLQQESR